MTHTKKNMAVCRAIKPTALVITPYYLFITGLFVLVFLLSSCRKENVKPAPVPEPTAPEMKYYDLGNISLHYNGEGSAIDITGDGKADVLFDMYRVGDPVERADKWLWTVVTSSRTYLAIDPANDIPLLSKANDIPLDNFDNYEWFVANEGNLMQRKENENGHISWSGKWLNVNRKYIAVSPLIDGKRHNGWIEISTNSNTQTLTIHRAAISKEPGIAIKAGK